MPIFGASLTGVFTCTPSPRLMQISLLSAKFNQSEVWAKSSDIHLMRIYSNNANEKHSSMRLFPSPKNRIMQEPGVLANTTVLRRD